MSFAVREFLIDSRVPICAGLLVFVLASMFVLTSQSGSSFATYLLGFYVIYGVRGWSPLLASRLFWAVVALLAYLVTTSFWSASWGSREVLSEVVRALLVLTFVIAVAECLSVDWFGPRMTRVLGLFGGAAALVAIVMFYLEPPPDDRLAGLGQLDTHIEAALVFAVAGVCAMASMRRGDHALGLHLASFVVLIYAVVLSDSRTAMVSLWLGAYAYLLSRLVRSARRYMAGMFIGLLTMAVIAMLAYWWIPGVDGLLFPRGDSFRLGTWRELLSRIWSGGPWFGLGILTPGSVVIDGYTIMHPHNIYVAVLHQGGLVGLVLLAAVVLSTVWSLLIHYERLEAKLALAIFAVGLSGFLLDGVTLVDKIGWTWFIFWLPVAIALGLSNRVNLADAARFSGRFEV